ncbi:hypothetical protein [Paenibacillus illinoisensis]|uniref:hypothetical protein n=1 Tax=Paenibacillus illinoisensis TaxID=59845 RepID=UPI00203B828A|nr:hypothetical protein [Paenibacillus illinoisensis]MCM3208523.1 hypothetical protein [Paenibacillus illinoisensis]
MADRRMISKVISMSEKVGDLNNVFDMLLFTWMIPHTDDFGRLTGSPKKVNLMVVPHIEKSTTEVSESLGRLHDAGLINWYEVDGDQVIQINDFEKHQPGLHKRTKPKFPDPPDHSGSFPEFPGSSEQFPKIPPEGNRSKENLREGNRSKAESIETVTTTADDLEKIEKAYGQIHGCMGLKPKDWPLVTGLINQGISSDLIIEVMVERHKKKVEEGGKVNGFSFYTNAIKEKHAQGKSQDRLDFLDDM